jgi:hypothetical protein
MRLCYKGWAWKCLAKNLAKSWAAPVALLALLAAPAWVSAATCTTQAELLPQDRDALASVAGGLAEAVAAEDFPALKAALLPAVAPDWEQIHQAVEAAAPLVKGGRIQLRSLYLLDASSLAAPADTQFFCSNSSGTLTVSLTMKALPPGRYAVVLADAAGAPLGGQLAFILAWESAGSTWKLGGLTVRPGVLDGHDGLWWWTRARELARESQQGSEHSSADAAAADSAATEAANAGSAAKAGSANAAPHSFWSSWSAWYAYEAARLLLLPVDFLSSPNLEKLDAEQAQLGNSPRNAFPSVLPDGPRTWKIDAVHLDPTLLHADLGVVYESTGVTDPAAQHTEAVAVLSALLKAQPGLRENFHGLWAYAIKDGKQSPVIELPMAQIP